VLLSQFLNGNKLQRIAPKIYGACGRLIIVEHSGRLLATYLNESFVMRAELALQLLSLVQVFWVRVLLYPAVPQTPIVGVHRCLSGSSKNPR